MNFKKMVREQITKFFDMQYRHKLKKHIISYATWIERLEKEAERDENDANVSCTSVAAGTGSKVACSDFLLLPSTEGVWAERAGQKVSAYFAAHPQVLLVYGDEDVINDKGVRMNPWFKPDWSPDSFLCRDYLGGAVAVRKSLYEKLTEAERGDAALCHRRLVELAGGFVRNCKTIGHVREICFHRNRFWMLPEGTVAAKEAGENAGCGVTDFISIIIPSKDNEAVLKQCLSTVQRTVTGIPYEIIIVDNGSAAQTKALIEKEVAQLNQDCRQEDGTAKGCLQKVRYLYEPMEFHFSKMCNMGADAAEGKLLLFLNDDMEAVNPGWLEAMAEKAVKPWVGAVGSKLLYPDGERIQHAGITNIGIGPVHKLQFLNNNKCYYDGRNRGIWNVLAVTGACLLIRKELFEETGGFAEELRVAFNDVDLCYTLHEKGYYNVVLNNTHLLHHESLSRGADESDEKVKRLLKEREQLYKRHPLLEGCDPYYHPLLNQKVLDIHIRPGSEEGLEESDSRGMEKWDFTVGARQDDCLLVRIEYADNVKIQGYAIVLGSDNACFAKKLLFVSETGENYCVNFTERYRSDLQKNMPDQKNIALSGFDVEICKPAPAGEYRIGVVAKDKISGNTIMNMSNRKVYFKN